ncbi:hypothetical protein EE612_028830, partial [Oryza sativa]
IHLAFLVFFFAVIAGDEQGDAPVEVTHGDEQGEGGIANSSGSIVLEHEGATDQDEARAIV